MPPVNFFEQDEATSEETRQELRSHQKRDEHATTSPTKTLYSDLAMSIHETPATARAEAIGGTNSIFSREMHMLHRRSSSPEIIGVTVGLSILVAVIGVGLYLWCWKNTEEGMRRVKKREGNQRTSSKKKKEKAHEPRGQDDYHDHMGNRPHSEVDSYEVNHVHGLHEHPLIGCYHNPEHHERHCPRHEYECSSRHHEHGHHHRNHSQKQRRRRSHRFGSPEDLMPQLPEPTLQVPDMWTRRHGHHSRSHSQPQNEMDAPQINRGYPKGPGFDLGWKLPHIFNQPGTRGSRIVCPRHGPLPDNIG
ncbi:hypothetical protein FALBO_10824 [Fusarium albosuccineum]|uniref:Uncharacterized protein n=1 Tax=Fusarium albosuccineum TaxID=1237068 RepID=A0A8H4P7S0_9HYPO|nr:hypothetical protein FALBO_10824 [Fusarium albosuccineum]